MPLSRFVSYLQNNTSSAVQLVKFVAFANSSPSYMRPAVSGVMNGLVLQRSGGRRMFVLRAPSAESFSLELKEQLAMLLELAAEHLDCQEACVVVEKTRVDVQVVVRAVMYLGFSMAPATKLGISDDFVVVAQELD
jgi:hypothetical protein